MPGKLDIVFVHPEEEAVEVQLRQELEKEAKQYADTHTVAELDAAVGLVMFSYLLLETQRYDAGEESDESIEDLPSNAPAEQVIEHAIQRRRRKVAAAKKAAAQNEPSTSAAARARPQAPMSKASILLMQCRSVLKEFLRKHRVP